MTSPEHSADADISWLTATITAAFCALATAVYAAVEAEPSPEIAFFISAAPLWAVVLWLHRDTQRTGVGSVLDSGLFLCMFWPFVIPWYAWRTRGRSGWRLAAALYGLIWSAALSWVVIAWTVYGYRYALWYFR